MIVSIVGIIFGGAYYWQIRHAPTVNMKWQTAEESDKYVRFDMEVYDKIAKIYWMTSTDNDLATLFQLSSQKAFGLTTTLVIKDRAGTAKMLATAFSSATTTSAKKESAVNTAIIALYNIAPVGRNQVLSQKQETVFRQNVSNINPSSDLYGELGLASDASVQEVDKAYTKKFTELKNATSTEDKARLKQIAYSHSVLSNMDNKSLYDTAKIESTVAKIIYGKTLYIDMTKVSPTTLIEFARVVDDASTTPGLDSMILDFRGNVGGSLDFLPNFFGLFVGKDQYVFDFYQQGNYIPQRSVQPKFSELDRFKDIAILTDNMTQSTAELTTATFKKFHMAQVVGNTTRGWGTIENTYPIDTEIDPTEKYLLLLVNSITLREDNQPIEGRGVEPDVDIGKVGWQNELPKHFKSESLINAIKKEIK